jgi:polysaccharide biosynthesis transport protein
LCKTALAGLDVLLSGPKPSNPADAVMLPEFAQLIEDLRAQYDMVIIDSPPMLACTDASNISSHVDGVLLALRIRRNIKPLSRRATHMLRSLHVNLIGVVVNAIGDSGYSASYGASWSTQYGGMGTEYGYSYNKEISGKYLNGSDSQETVVIGSGFRNSDFLQAVGTSVMAGSGVSETAMQNAQSSSIPSGSRS